MGRGDGEEKYGRGFVFLCAFVCGVLSMGMRPDIPQQSTVSTRLMDFPPPPSLAPVFVMLRVIRLFVVVVVVVVVMGMLVSIMELAGVADERLLHLLFML